jgi:hypothetical protein
VVARKRGEDLLVRDRLHLEPRRRERRPREAEVERAGGERVELLARRELAEPHLHLWVRGAERADDVRDQRVGHGPDEPQPDEPGPAGAGATRRLDRPVEVPEEHPHVAQERLPRGGQTDAAVRPDEQDRPDAILELGDRLAQRRLRDVQPARGSAEAPVLGDSDEVAEVAKLELIRRVNRLHRS